MTRVRSFDPRARRRAASGPDRRPATIREVLHTGNKPLVKDKKKSKKKPPPPPPRAKENNGAKDGATASETKKGKGGATGAKDAAAASKTKKGKKGAK